MSTLAQPTREALFEYLLRLGDDLLILGHRLSEWCGHGPILEEDIALSNIALDFVGQAEAILGLAGELEGEGRSADDLAYLRDEYEFRNIQLVERPKGDFGFTIMRSFLYDAFSWLLYQELEKSSYAPLAAIAARALKEITYHLRHSREWVLRLGDGTEESNRRAQEALDALWMFTDELFFMNDVDKTLIAEKIVPNLEDLRGEWRDLVSSTVRQATLTLPEDGFMTRGSREGMHSEHLGHLLAEMQILARSHPGAEW